MHPRGRSAELSSTSKKTASVLKDVDSKDDISYLSGFDIEENTVDVSFKTYGDVTDEPTAL